MRIRSHLSYANVVATVALIAAIAGGSAYAASLINTSDIANKAVTAKKLASGAVQTSKLANGAVKGKNLANGAVTTQSLSKDAPVALAGADVVGNSSVYAWFNRLNDQQLKVTRTQAGVYELRIPGLTTEAGFSPDQILASATLYGTDPGSVATLWVANSAGEDMHAEVHTYDAAGNPADRSFYYLITQADHGAAG